MHANTTWRQRGARAGLQRITTGLIQRELRPSNCAHRCAPRSGAPGENGARRPQKRPGRSPSTTVGIDGVSTESDGPRRRMFRASGLSFPSSGWLAVDGTARTPSYPQWQLVRTSEHHMSRRTEPTMQCFMHNGWRGGTLGPPTDGSCVPNASHSMMITCALISSAEGHVHRL